MPVAEDMLGLESGLGEPQGPQLYNPTKRSNVSGEGGLAEITPESSWKEARLLALTGHSGSLWVSSTQCGSLLLRLSVLRGQEDKGPSFPAAHAWLGVLQG